MAEMQRETVQYGGTGQGHSTHSIITGELRGLHEPDVPYEAYKSRLVEINDTWSIIDDPETGDRFEIAVVNESSLPKDMVLFPSTDFSSLTQNVGNAIELAASGAEKPNTAIVYVAYPGNGGSRSLHASDRVHFMRTGRFTHGSHTDPAGYRPVRTVAAMARAVEAHIGTPNHISGDISGARLGLGLMAALDKNSIKDAYLNGIPGISPTAHYAAAMLKEDLAGRIERRRDGEYIPGEVVPASIREAKALLPKVYKGLGHDALWLSTYGKAAVNVPVNLMGLRGHDNLDRLPEHAVFQDIMAALVRQESIITLQFNRESTLHNVGDCVRFGKLVMDHIPDELQSDNRGVELLISTGTLDEHTVNPAGRLASERYGLRSIARFMRLVLRGDGSTATELPLAELEKAA